MQKTKIFYAICRVSSLQRNTWRSRAFLRNATRVRENRGKNGKAEVEAMH